MKRMLEPLEVKCNFISFLEWGGLLTGWCKRREKKIVMAMPKTKIMEITSLGLERRGGLSDFLG